MNSVVDYYSCYDIILGGKLGGKEITCGRGGPYCNVAKSLCCKADIILKPYAYLAIIAPGAISDK